MAISPNTASSVSTATDTDTGYLSPNPFSRQIKELRRVAFLDGFASARRLFLGVLPPTEYETSIDTGIDTGIDTATAETVTELHQRIVLLEQKLAAATARNQKQLQAILAAVGEAE